MEHERIAARIKVLLMCDDSLRIDRIVNRDGVSVEKRKSIYV